MPEFRLTIMLTVEEIASLEATVRELENAWTKATPSLLLKLRMETNRASNRVKRKGPKRGQYAKTKAFIAAQTK